MPSFTGTKVTQDAQAAAEFGLHRVTGEYKSGLSLEPGHIHYGKNSGFQALNLAVLLGAARIILLGFDMRIADGKRHFFGDHPRGLNEESPYEKFIAAFKTTTQQLQDIGTEVINGTPGSALECFRKDELHNVV